MLFLSSHLIFGYAILIRQILKVLLKGWVTMTKARFAFIKANWHGNIVNQALAGFQQKIDAKQIDVFDVPGALKSPC